MLIALWSPKGGSGTSVLAASLALVLARGRLVRVPAGRSRRRPTRDLRARRRTRARAARLARRGAGDAHGGARPARGRGGARRGAAPARRAASRALTARPEAVAGAALAVALRDGPMPVIVDCGRAAEPAARAPWPKSPTRRSSSSAAATSRCAARCGRPRSPARWERCSSRSPAGRSPDVRSPTCSACRSSLECRSATRSSAPSTPACCRRGCPTFSHAPRLDLAVRVGVGPAHRGAAA